MISSEAFLYGEHSPTRSLFIIGFDLAVANIGYPDFWRYVIKINDFGTNLSNRDL